jgi:hypothetical protein
MAAEGLRTSAADLTQMTSGLEAGAEYLDALEDAFLTAERRAGCSEQFYSVAGNPLRLRLAGDALAPLIKPPLEHLVSSSRATPALTICAWDPETTGVHPPACPWNAGDDGDQAKISVSNWDGVEFALFKGSGELNVLDRRRKLGFHCVSRAAAIFSGPLLIQLHWWLGELGLHCIHAGAVGFKDGGALLVGKGGSGKSTSALCCLDSNLGYVADDHCLLSAGPAPYVHSLYSSGKLTASQLDQLSFLDALAESPKGIAADKTVIFLDRRARQKLLPGFPVRMVLVPRIVGGLTTTAVAISPVEALKALAPSTLFQLIGASQKDFHAMAELVKNVPCYRLELGTDLRAIAGAIERLLVRSFQ